MKHREFTEEEMRLLLQNPYTAQVTPHSIKHTLEFKQFFIKEYEKGVRPKAIYARAGYDIEIIGESRIRHRSKQIRDEAASPEGLKAADNKRAEQLKAFSQQDLSRIQSEKAIKKLQEEIIILEQEVDFLKKILFLKK